MSGKAAVAFLDRLETDEPFAERIGALKGDPPAVFSAIRDAGFDATPEEVKLAIAQRFGGQLSPEQLEAIAGGVEIDWGIAIGTMFAAGVIAIAAASI